MVLKRGLTTRLLAAGVLLAVLGAAGCAAVGYAAAVIHDAKPREVPAQYTGLAGESFAIVVAADRIIQADHPGIVARLTMALNNEDLAQKAGASGWIPPERLLLYQNNNPRWVTLPLGELADELGVTRLIFVDLFEYRLNEPGNRYLWDGLASGNVGVIEADSPLADDYSFEQLVQVRFPDGETSYGPMDMSRQVVTTELSRRFAQRVAWLFFDHEESNELRY